MLRMNYVITNSVKTVCNILGLYWYNGCLSYDGGALLPAVHAITAAVDILVIIVRLWTDGRVKL